MIRRRHGRVRVVVLVVVALGLAGSVAAQEGSPNFWGSGTNFHFVSAEEFQSEQTGSILWVFSGNGFWRMGSNTGWCYAPVRLPTGSLVTGMTIIYQDDDLAMGEDIQVEFLQFWVTAAGVAGETQIGPTFESTGAPGVAAFWVDIDPDHTIQYIDGPTAQSYVLRYYSRANFGLRLRGVIIGWNRQISPAPVDPTFPDVAPGYWAFQEIEALAASGITTGFPDGTFRPTAAVTRAQMATFLARALGLHWAP